MNLKAALFLILAGLNIFNIIYVAVPVLIVSGGSKGWVRFGLSLGAIVASFIGAAVTVVRGVP
jgi:hypothetical protein